jgi:hypothetical protein
MYISGPLVASRLPFCLRRFATDCRGESARQSAGHLPGGERRARRGDEADRALVRTAPIVLLL